MSVKSSPWLSRSLFHVVAFKRTCPKAFWGALASGLALSIAATTCIAQWQQLQSAQQQLRGLQAQQPRASASLAVLELPKPANLPRFEGGPLVDEINQVALDLGLPIDEISYVLEDTSTQPFLRYRMTLSIASSYPKLRRFIDALSMSLPNATLDSISCTRDDILQATPNCDLAFSMFFRKEKHE